MTKTSHAMKVAENRRLELEALRAGHLWHAGFREHADNQHRDNNARGAGQCPCAESGPCFTAELHHSLRLDGSTGYTQGIRLSYRRPSNAPNAAHRRVEASRRVWQRRAQG